MSPRFGMSMLSESLGVPLRKGFEGAAISAAAPSCYARPSSTQDGRSIAVENLRGPTPRPEVLVDAVARSTGDPTDSPSRIGQPGPLGRERCLFALPLSPGPALLSSPTLLHDAGPAAVADPVLEVVGSPATWVSRMLTARWTEDTRRF